MENPTRIMGIDPGLRHTGWGVIESNGTELSFVASGTVNPSVKSEMAERLRQIHEALIEVFESHKPQETAIEEAFFNKFAGATIKLGQARSAAMLVPALAGVPVAEYAPNQIKKTVVGTGHCQKEQIRMMVKVLLPKAEINSNDAADALAIAICHAQHRKILENRVI